MIIELMTPARRSPSPAHVAKVGDTPADLEEGHNAGCGLVVGVVGGTHTREQLEPYPHTHLIETIADFPALLASSSQASADTQKRGQEPIPLKRLLTPLFATPPSMRRLGYCCGAGGLGVSFLGLPSSSSRSILLKKSWTLPALAWTFSSTLASLMTRSRTWSSIG